MESYREEQQCKMRRGDGPWANEPHHCSTFLCPNRSHKSLHLCSPLSSCKVYQNIPGCNVTPFFGSQLDLGNHHNPPNTRTECYISRKSGNSTCICPQHSGFHHLLWLTILPAVPPGHAVTSPSFHFLL